MSSVNVILSLYEDLAKNRYNIIVRISIFDIEVSFRGHATNNNRRRRMKVESRQVRQKLAARLVCLYAFQAGPSP